MSTQDKIQREILPISTFHTTALWSPTRQALLTGRNHHTVGKGGYTEMAASAPGNNSMRSNTCALPAEWSAKYSSSETEGTL